MRIRTADVKIKLATGIQSVFDLAVERNLAWLVGTGHVYADLEKVAKRNGYLLEVVEQEGDDLDFWIAVRANLVHDEILHNGNGIVAFAAVRDDLGSVGIGLTSVSFNRTGEEDRITNTTQGAAIDTPEYEYFDQVYTVTSLKN